MKIIRFVLIKIDIFFNKIIQGMKRFHVRTAIIKELIAKNLFIEIKENPMVVPICSRSKDVVEPLIKPQW